MAATILIDVSKVYFNQAFQVKITLFVFQLVKITIAFYVRINNLSESIR